MIFTYTYIARQLNMSLKCVMCGEPLLPRAPNFCSVCKLPCHKKCANKHKNVPCDRCRAVERAQKAKQSADLDGSKRAACNMHSTARLTPGSFGEARRGKTHAPTSVVKQTRASASSSPLAAVPLKAFSATARWPPLLNSLLGETLSTARKAPSVEGASSAPNSNCADESFAISTSAADENDISMKRNNSSITGGSSDNTNSGDAAPSLALPVYRRLSGRRCYLG